MFRLTSGGALLTQPGAGIKTAVIAFSATGSRITTPEVSATGPDSRIAGFPIRIA